MLIGGVSMIVVAGSCLAIATAWGLMRGRTEHTLIVLSIVALLVLLVGARA